MKSWHAFIRPMWSIVEGMGGISPEAHI